MVERERIDKLGAARRQMRTAIWLFFREDDAVSVHTLTEAARELLRDLLKADGAIGHIEQGERDWIVPERLKEYRDILRRPKNFFKHADSDPDEVIEFAPESTAFSLLDCVLMYEQYTKRQLWCGFLFVMWFFATYPEVLNKGPVTARLDELRAQMPSVTKGDFLALFDKPLPNMDT